MKKQSLFFVFLTLSACLIIWACNKAKNVTKSASKSEQMQAMKTISGGLSFPCDLPSVEGGMLVFSTVEQYQCYYDFITASINADTSGNTDVDSALLALETTLGYTSIRSVSYAAFEDLNQIGWATYQEIPEEDCISSRVLRSILNQDREVQIAGNYTKYFSPDFLISVDAAYPDMIRKVKALSSSAKLEVILVLVPLRLAISVSS